MFWYYLKFSWRHLRKSFSYSFINIAGLSIGLASVLLIFLYVQDELSYDGYHEKKDRIYRVLDYGGLADLHWSSIVEGNPAPVMAETFPGIEEAVSLSRSSFCGSQVTARGNTFRNVTGKCTQSGIFNTFSFSLSAGNPDLALDEPHSVVLSRSMAQHLFPDGDGMGETVKLEGLRLSRDSLFTVTGVMEDIPENTHFHADMFVSWNSMTVDDREQGHYHYVLLGGNTEPGDVTGQMRENLAELGFGDNSENVRLQPLEEIYFAEIGGEKSGTLNYIYMLTAIAAVILLLACGNYLNLATARYANRSTEIGIRKVLGAHRGQLIRQFLTETLILTCLALPVALLLTDWVIPFFNSYAGAHVALDLGQNLPFLGFLALILAATGLLAGSYPALVSSSVNPSEVLRGTMKKFGFSASGFRKGLVSFQFLVSLTMIGITTLILQQINYVEQKDMGYDTEGVVYVSMQGFSNNGQAGPFKEQALRYPEVSNATVGNPPGGTLYGTGRGGFPAAAGRDTVDFRSVDIDSDFLSTMGLTLLAGGNIAGSTPPRNGTREVIVNRTAVEAMGWRDPSQAVGKLVGDNRIVGVVEDFHGSSLKQPVRPLMLRQYNYGFGNGVMVRLAPDRLQEGIEHLRTAWEEIGQATPLDYTFLDDRIGQQYRQERNTARVIGVFAGLSILIACMGLFGLAAYTVEQRFKEIGIRKVLGAGAGNIVLLLYRDFGMLLAIASLLAAPLIYMAGSRWLENFAYHVQLGPSVFAISLLAVALLTVLVTGARSLRAALMNPVDAIKDE